MQKRHNQRGASLVEHGLLIGLVAIVSIGAVSQLAFQVEDSFSQTSDALAGNLDHILPPAERGPLANVAQVCYEGTSGNDRIEYNAQETIYNCLHGYAGNDELIWSVHTPASFYPGPGNDKTFSGNGDQVHYYESGHDEIEDDRGEDTLIFPRGTAFSDATFSAPDYGDQNGAKNLRIDLAQGSITLIEQFDLGGVSTFIFDDRELDRSELSAMILAPYPTEGADTLYGTYDDDAISPLAGDDVVYAGFGDDQINYASGNDTYYPGHDNDTLVMPFALSQVSGRIQGNHSDLFFDLDTGAELWVPRQFSVAPWMNNGVRFTSFEFSDQTLSWDEMRLRALRDMESSDSQLIYGSHVADEIWSDGAYIRVQPNPGDDIVHWVSGEIYLSGKGGGHDTLVLSTIDRDSITTETTSKDVLIRLPGGERITFEKYMQSSEGDGGAAVERIIFANDVVLEEREVRDLFGAP